MERDEFLSKLGIGLVAVCAGCSLVSCGGSKSGNPAPGPGNTPPPGPGTGNVFSVNLSTDLKNIGDSKVSNGIILVRIAADDIASSFTAVQVACTHEGAAINYHSDQGIFICPNHFSHFSTSGQVLVGPATRALQKYNVVISGSTLTVTA